MTKSIFTLIFAVISFSLLGQGIEFVDATWQEAMEKAKQENKLLFVDSYAKWCGPCKQIGPALEELSSEMEGKVKIVKVNVDENPNSPAQMGVRGIPALFVFKNGEVVYLGDPEKRKTFREAVERIIMWPINLPEDEVGGLETTAFFEADKPMICFNARLF